MKSTTAPSYSQFRSQLSLEKAALEQRLAKLNEALRAIEGIAGPRPGRKPGRPPGTATSAAPASTGRKRRGYKRANNTMSLRQAMLKAMGSRPLTKPEILSGVQKEGYKFSASNPMNSINVMLYTKGLFKKLPGKRFTPAK